MNRRTEERQAVRLGWACGLAVLVAACAQPGGSGGSAPAPAAPQPAASPAPEAPASAPTEPAPAPEPAVPYSPATAQRLTIAAIESLELGHVEQATEELRRALQADPGHRLAQTMMRQVESDPLEMLGRESFAYRVQPGETLSRIAQRFLGDVHLFYILARYNDIPVPRQLQGGQMLRIPGKAPPPGAMSPAPAPTPAPTPPPAAPTPAPAPPPSAPAPAPAPEPPRPTEAERQAKITAATRAARAAFARQDLDTAIKQWDLVLELDPQHATAQLERRRAMDLRERLRKVR